VAFGIAAWLTPNGHDRGMVDVRRDFFGVLRVQDHLQDKANPWRGLYHGRVLHGLQAQMPGARRAPTAYYSAISGAVIAFQQHSRRIAGQPLNVAVIGLGTGTIAAWGRNGDRIQFFELSPSVVDVARRHFTFLDDSAARTSVVVGDARLTLERQMTNAANHGTYDVIVIDAFSGDSVPVHLLTRECFAVYRQALTSSGVLLFHVSNRHLDLRLPVRGAAVESGYSTVEITTARDSGFQSEWVIATTDEEFLARALARGAIPSPPNPRVVWTDHFSSVLTVLK
jgi:hypothetical protein